jgi:hypothetical protein
MALSIDLLPAVPHVDLALVQLVVYTVAPYLHRTDP